MNLNAQQKEVTRPTLLVTIEKNIYVHYLCRLLIYGHQICIQMQLDMTDMTDLPRFYLLFEVTGVQM